MATATFTEVVDRAIGDPLTEAIWDDQLKDNVNQLGGAHRNLLVNGGFEVWQRGTSGFSTSAGGYCADRWFYEAGVSIATNTITRESSTKETASQYSLKSVITSWVVAARIYQAVEDFTQLRGRTVSFSIRVHQSVASLLTPIITDSAGTTNGSTSATTGSFVTLTVTRTINSGATSVLVGVAIGGNGTYYLDNAMLVIGPAPAPYQPLTPQEEMARCQRYYEVHSANNAMHMGGYNGAGGVSYFFIPFATAKGGTPTTTKNGTWGTTNCGQPSITSTNSTGYSLQVTVTALGAFLIAGNGADDTITAEWNP